MTKRDKSKIFKTMREYKAFYTANVKREQSKGSKYYRIGEDIAEKACGKAIRALEQEQATV